MQVIPAEFGAQLPLLFPCYASFWRDGDTSRVPTMQQLCVAGWAKVSAALTGRKAAYQRLDAQSAAAPAAAGGSGEKARAGQEPSAFQQPWVAEDGSAAKAQRSSGRVLAEMRNLRKVRGLLPARTST